MEGMLGACRLWLALCSRPIQRQRPPHLRVLALPSSAQDCPCCMREGPGGNPDPRQVPSPTRCNEPWAGWSSGLRRSRPWPVSPSEPGSSAAAPTSAQASTWASRRHRLSAQFRARHTGWEDQPRCFLGLRGCPRDALSPHLGLPPPWVSGSGHSPDAPSIGPVNSSPCAVASTARLPRPETCDGGDVPCGPEHAGHGEATGRRCPRLLSPDEHRKLWRCAVACPLGPTGSG